MLVAKRVEIEEIILKRRLKHWNWQETRESQRKLLPTGGPRQQVLRGELQT